MKRILVPLDGSEFAERALAPALQLARRTGAEVHLATVVSDLPPVPLASADGDLVSQWFEEEEERAKKYLSEVQEGAAGKEEGVTVETHVRLGPVARTLHLLADELDADLVTLTTHGRGAWQRAWLGSVADQLLRKAERPLLLFREAEDGSVLFGDPGSPEHVLVPLDGSKASESVLDVLPRILDPEGGSRVTLVSVLQKPFPLATTYLPHAVSEERLLEDRKNKLEGYLGEAKGRLTEQGFRVDARALTADDAATALLELAGKEKVDLVALSTRGRGGVSRFLLGSVADKVVRGASTPVLTVRRPDDDDEV